MTPKKGKSPHKMIEDSILFGAERWTVKAEKAIEKIDIFLGIDPAFEKAQRQKRKAMNSVLETIAFKAPTPPPAVWGEGYKALMQEKFIERKRGHTKLTTKGKAEKKRLETAVHRMFFSGTTKGD